MTLTFYKGKQVGAQKGYDLLKKKSDALAVRYVCLWVCLREFGAAFKNVLLWADDADSERSSRRSKRRSLPSERK